MRQALHILRKDIRYLCPEVAVLIILPALVTWTATRLSLRSALFVTSDLLEFVTAAVIAYVITRLIHAEAIPGENQFWLTRPYRWQSLLAAKLLFIVAFVNLPFLLVQAAVLLDAGFHLTAILPGLLWSQVLLFCGVALPLAALAAMTKGLVQFLGAILLLSMLGLAALSKTRWGGPEAIEWQRTAILFVTVILPIAPVLYLQYRARKTPLSRSLAAAVAIAGVLVYLFTPWQTLFAVQSTLGKEPLDLLRISLHPQRPSLLLVPYNLRPEGLLLAVDGLPSGSDLKLENYTAIVTTSDQKTIAFGARYDDRKIWLGSNDLNFHPGQKLTLRATFYFTAFGNSRDQQFTLTHTPTDVIGGLRCFAGYKNQLTCLAPFRWPGLLVSEKTTTGTLSTLTNLISYSPFPSSLEINPIAANGLVFYSEANPAPVRRITINVREPIAHVRRDIEIRDIPVIAHDYTN